jgi:HMG (high mobility group) box
MIDFDSSPSIDTAPFRMDRELLRTFLLQNTGGADDNDTPLDDAMAMNSNTWNFLNSYKNQQQQIDAQISLLAKTEQQQQQHQEQQLAHQQQQMLQQHQQGVPSIGMEISSSISNQSTNPNANSSAASGFAPGGLLHSFFSKQDAEEQERNSIQSQHGTAQFQRSHSLLPQGEPGNTLLSGWMSEQQPVGGYANSSNAGLNRRAHSSVTIGGANNRLMENRGDDQLSHPPLSSFNAGNTAWSSSATGVPDSLSYARLSAPSLLSNVRSCAGFASAVAQPTSDASITANMRNQGWNYSSAAPSGSDFGSSVATPKNAIIGSKRSQFHDQESTTNSFYADNGTIGPWSAASAAILGDLALDSEEKWGKQRKTNKKDKPKRPLSAYNIFFKEERERILEKLPDSVPKEEIAQDDAIGDKKKKRRGAICNDHVSGNIKKKPHGKIDFQSLAKIVGKRWQSLDEDELQLYKAKANADMKRYRDEMKIYNASLLKGKEEQDQLQQQEMQPNQFLF